MRFVAQADDLKRPFQWSADGRLGAQHVDVRAEP
jgi:hypothetical protein